jgi:hypothetical protein
MRDLPLGDHGQITLPPESLAVLTRPIDPGRRLEKKIVLKEFFSKAIMTPIPASRSLNVEFALPGGLQTQAKSAHLRWGVRGACTDKPWTVEIAGETLTLSHSDAYLDIPLTRVPQGYPVRATFKPQGKPDGKFPNLLCFASLILETTETIKPHIKEEKERCNIPGWAW